MRVLFKFLSYIDLLLLGYRRPLLPGCGVPPVDLDDTGAADGGAEDDCVGTEESGREVDILGGREARRVSGNLFATRPSSEDGESTRRQLPRELMNGVFSRVQ